ncbi:disease resistance protein Roq1-like [Macadamia integrifolia]|uniref:disease resistance protein Roq1-like n=1 Tax=Macadamia integrifolia TaxID=60698 RepID=UPI001C53210E|nr:disease resistance protein Roq1-like [Macadamia integrifolia]
MTYGSSSSFSRWKYDVFLSFCGQDTRKTFTGYLFNELARNGIHTFKDDNELNRGEDISSKLMEAIEGSRIAIIIFSKNYASSTWCLGELVKILDCRTEDRTRHLLPVYYEVDRLAVRNQRDTYAEAFTRHEKRFEMEMEKVNMWRAALREAADISGWDQGSFNGHDVEFINKIINQVVTIVSDTCLHVAEHPIGLNSHIEILGCFLEEEFGLHRIIGIYGSAGIGKTTIAKAIFNSIVNHFEGSYFLANVREKSLVFLQQQLLSGVMKKKCIDIRNEDHGIKTIKTFLRSKKVLIVLDDVDKAEQFYKLVGGHGWFGLGSRIILTTRDEHLLNSLDVDKKYMVETMNQTESLQLFSWHAFRQNHPLEGFVQLSNDVITYAGGLPLALEILGSHLYKRNQVEWESELMKLRKIPNDQILEKLLSYNVL